MLSTFFLCIFLVALLVLSAFLSASETALFSLSSLQLKVYRQSKNSRLEMIYHLMQRPRDVLVTILMLNVLANILVQNTVSSLFSESLGWGLKVGFPLALTLIFGEILPKSIAMSNNEQISKKVAPWIAKISTILGPLRRVITRITGWISRFFFLFLRETEEISPEELKVVLKTSEESGILLKQERRLVHGALQSQETRVLERMRPREEILYYDLADSLSILLHLFIEQQVTRIPVCEENLENMKGILSADDFFFVQPKIQTSADLLPILKKPYFVPETTKVLSLLETLREKNEALAIAVDEYGSIVGLVTQEDLIENVIGEIADLRDAKSLYTRSAEDVIIASGKLELAEFNEIFGLSLESKENAVTLGGWLIEQLGTIPSTGTKYANDQFLFYVLAAEPNRIRRIYVRKLPQVR